MKNDVPVPAPPAETPPRAAVDIAVEQARCSPCRSQRGAVVFSEATRGPKVVDVYGRGHNRKPDGFDCDGSLACKATCRVEAVHAEQVALLNAGRRSPAARTEMLHVKVVDGALVPSGRPSCVQCSKLALAAGIVGVWLYHESGWHRYDASEFHRLSLRADPSPAPPAVPPRIVQQEWTWTIPLRMQSLLMLAMRGPDGCSKENSAKVLLRELRSVVLVPAFPGRPDSFMGTQRGVCDWDVVEAFKESHDEYPHHWLMHFIHAAEVVGQCHPDHAVQSFWWNVYVALCHAMHMKNENIDELFQRLGDPERAAEWAAPSPQQPMCSICRADATTGVEYRHGELRICTACYDELRQSFGEAAPRSPAREWQPIETAPKDGKR